MTFPTWDALHNHLKMESRTALFVFLVFNQLKLHLNLVLLAPFDELRLEVYLLISYLINIDKLTKNLLLHKLHASIIAMVKIERTNKCFESITTKITVMRRCVAVREYQLTDSHLFCQTIQRIALY